MPIGDRDGGRGGLINFTVQRGGGGGGLMEEMGLIKTDRALIESQKAESSYVAG